MDNKALHIVKGWVCNLCRLLLAAVYLFSGFVKAIDPHGTEYKIQDYLVAFGLHDVFPDVFPLLLSMTLAVVEFIVGVFLFFGIRRHFSAWASLLMLSVMTPLTFYLALYNPVSDCGCFGDALRLTNWQTFGKNILLLGCSISLMRWKDHVVRFISENTQWLISLYSLVSIIALELHCLYHLPVVDFRPYKIGTDIPAGMVLPKGAALPQFDSRFVLEKDGVRKEFGLDNYPDTTWTYIETKTVQVSDGYVPPIHDFLLRSLEEDEDITEKVLADTNYTFLLITPDLEQADESSLDLINELYDYARSHQYGFYALTASGANEIKKWVYETGADYPFCQVDGITLKTMVRSNPGLMLIKKGVVINKWGVNDLPDEYELTGSLDGLELGQLDVSAERRLLTAILLVLALPLLGITLLDRVWAGLVFLGELRRKSKIVNPLKKKKMRKKIVAGNWKMNKNLQDGIALAKELNEVLTADKPNCGVVICTPFIHLASVAGLVDSSIIGVGAENCADKASGAYTGEVSAEMVKSTGAQYVILGHSERRQYYNETPALLKEKVELALANGLEVIFCIGETLEEREANKQNEVVKAELEGSVFGLSEADFAKIVIAYEPIWAIGTGKTATAEQAEEIHAYIRSCVADKYGKEIAENTSILYGGSCKASNAPELFAKADIDGGLIGGASLKAADFKGIIDAFK